MTAFTIHANPPFLGRDIQAYYHTDFFGYGRPNNPDYLNVLKNDNHQNWSVVQLRNAVNQLRVVLLEDLPQILHLRNLNSLTVCVIPRSKAQNYYRPDQLLLHATVLSVVNEIEGLENGVEYIHRIQNTRTTHLRRPMDGFVNDGLQPYAGITIDTCEFSEDIHGRDILLIDDIYTRTVNIDEDAIQALLNLGANSVTFYAIGNTAH